MTTYCWWSKFFCAHKNGKNLIKFWDVIPGQDWCKNSDGNERYGNDLIMSLVETITVIIQCQVNIGLRVDSLSSKGDILLDESF